MPKVVKQMPGRKNRKYDWDTAFDGKAREYVKGEDFDTAPATFQATAFVSAKRRDVKVAVRVRGDSVFIQAEV